MNQPGAHAYQACALFTHASKVFAENSQSCVETRTWVTLQQKCKAADAAAYSVLLRGPRHINQCIAQVGSTKVALSTFYNTMTGRWYAASRK